MVKWKEWAPGCFALTLYENEHISIKIEVMLPGTSDVPHFHTVSTQWFLITNGIATFTFQENTHELNAGQLKTVKSCEIHSIANNSKRKIRFLVISSPPATDNRINI